MGRPNTFRVKVVPPCGDAHYFYAATRAEADRVMDELREDLDGQGCSIYLYVETRYGHVRVR